MEIALLIPGLLGPPGLPQQADPPTPVIDRLLAGARRQGAPVTDPTRMGDERALIQALGLEAVFGETLPSAPYCLSTDDPRWDHDGFWLHADPVHLRADRDQLRLFDGGMLAIQPDEARQLIAELNAHFATDGMRLHAPAPERWYLRAPGPVALRTRPLRSVMGATLAEAMPSGADAKRWNALMNEAQMLMHQSAINRARIDSGRAPINGLWLSGAGAYSALERAPDLRLVIAEDPLALGLARACGLPTAWLDAEDLTKQLAGIPAGRVLLVEQRLGDALRRHDLSAWEDALRQLDRQLEPVLAWIGEQRHGRAARAPTLCWQDGTGTSWISTPARSGPIRRWLARLRHHKGIRGLSAARALVHSPGAGIRPGGGRG